MKNRNITILAKIVDEATTVADMLGGIDESAFLSSEEKKRAVCMTFINIGELVKNLDADFRAMHAHIPWKRIAGLRDIAAHGYFTLSMNDVRMTAMNALPHFASQIKEILNAGVE